MVFFLVICAGFSDLTSEHSSGERVPQVSVAAAGAAFADAAGAATAFAAAGAAAFAALTTGTGAAAILGGAAAA